MFLIVLKVCGTQTHSKVSDTFNLSPCVIPRLVGFLFLFLALGVTPGIAWETMQHGVQNLGAKKKKNKSVE